MNDRGGLASTEHSILFVIDQTPPPPPVVDSLPATTTINQQTISGDKAPNSALWLNGIEVVGHTASDRWSYTASLTEGENTLLFISRDRAGNSSIATPVRLIFDNTAPGAITPTVSNDGNGTHITVDWRGYNETANGNDIAGYRIYSSTQPYARITDATQVGTVNDSQSIRIGGLTRGTTYHIAVVAHDLMGNANPQVTPVAVTLQDLQPPAEVSGLLITPALDQLQLRWQASPAEDLAGYRATSTTMRERC